MVHLKSLLLYNWRTMNTEKLKTETNSFGFTKCSKALVITASHVRGQNKTSKQTFWLYVVFKGVGDNRFSCESSRCCWIPGWSHWWRLKRAWVMRLQTSPCHPPYGRLLLDSIKCLCLLRFRQSDVLTNRWKHLTHWSCRLLGCAKCYMTPHLVTFFQSN